ncbi:hypothetical protein EDD18DRAFT_1335917 [Armillaria luteobubalina]|uniref:Smr domain-containing protein n=1 Tax=Armillaria luteobubalina TaxID=153913 RepID=A0AA39TFA9_9AGAR|nr:hypothetical protein EDD18DRAFT_1335917 [Armillaria luteobubalina]
MLIFSVENNREAITRTDTALKEAKQRCDSEIRLIVGKGSDSEGGAKLGPAIEDLIRKYHLVAELVPSNSSNSGVLIVELNCR